MKHCEVCGALVEGIRTEQIPASMGPFIEGYVAGYPHYVPCDHLAERD